MTGHNGEIEVVRTTRAAELDRIERKYGSVPVDKSRVIIGGRKETKVVDVDPNSGPGVNFMNTIIQLGREAKFDTICVRTFDEATGLPVEITIDRAGETKFTPGRFYEIFPYIAPGSGK